MEPALDIVTVLIFLGVIQGLFLAVFFAAYKDRTVSNLYIALLLVSISAIIFEMLLGYSGLITSVLVLVDFSEPLNFTIGPLVYLALRAWLRSEPFRWRHLLHLVPFALYAIYHIPYLLQSAAFKQIAWLEAWRPQDSDVSVATATIDVDPWRIRRIVAELTIVHASAYIGVSLYALRTAFRERDLSFWSREDVDLAWWRRFVLQFLAIMAAVVVVKMMFPNDVGDYLIAVLVTAVVYGASVSVIARSSFFDSARSGAKKYEKSALTDGRRDALLERLEVVMVSEKPYLRPALSLADLAGRVSTSPHHLSQVLNEGAGCTFHEYIARYRVEAAKLLLSGPEGETIRIEDVAERVGYYSKSSFNTAFRRLTGVTPSEFRGSRAHTADP